MELVLSGFIFEVNIKFRTGKLEYKSNLKTKQFGTLDFYDL
jgi:hypothetical protein